MTPNFYGTYMGETYTGNISFMTEPERTHEFKQGYKEGFEAGKSALRAELKALIKSLPDKQVGGVIW